MVCTGMIIHMELHAPRVKAADRAAVSSRAVRGRGKLLHRNMAATGRRRVNACPVARPRCRSRLARTGTEVRPSATMAFALKRSQTQAGLARQTLPAPAATMTTAGR